MTIQRLSAGRIAGAVRARECSAEEVTRAALDAIARENGRINAFVQVFEDRALGQAREIDRRVAAGAALGPLAGVPVALKDNICLAWGRTTCASRMLERYESPYTATAAQRLIDAGAVVVGKTNLDEFAMGSSTEHSIFGPTRNPWDVSRVPGGSSGGSAAAVAAQCVPLALGSDTGGSIRQPAGFCGVVGVKPTYGRVSRYGLVAYASSLDQIGIFSTGTSDAALALDVLSAPDPLDSTSSPHAGCECASRLDDPLPEATVGVPRQARSDANHPAVAAALENAAAILVRLGVRVVDIDLPHTDYGIAAYYVVALAEAASNLSRYDGVRFGRRAQLAPGETLDDLYRRSRAEGFGPEVQRRIMLGTHVLSSGYFDAYYTNALKVRRRIKDDYDRAFRLGCHAVLMPSSPGPAFRVGEKSADPLALYLEDVYTVGVNLAGLPALTIPGGMAPGGANGTSGLGLPIGIQLIGQAFEEPGLLRLARMLEREIGFDELARPVPG